MCTDTGTRYLAGAYLDADLLALVVVSGLAAFVLADSSIRLLLFALSFGLATAAQRLHHGASTIEGTS
jgi:hypothetical protein